MSEYDELKSLAIEADARGDKETALAAMQRMEQIGQPQEQPQGPASFLSGVESEGVREAGKRTQQLGTAINRGMIHTLGLPATTANNLLNLAKSGIGSAALALGLSPEDAPEIVEHKDMPLTGEWLVNLVEKKFPGTLREYSKEDKIKKALSITGEVLGGSVAGGSAIVQEAAKKATLSAPRAANVMLSQIAKDPGKFMKGAAIYGGAAGAGSAAGEELVGGPLSQMAGGIIAPVGVAGLAKVPSIAREATPTGFAQRVRARAAKYEPSVESYAKYKGIQQKTGQRAPISAALSSKEMAGLESSVMKHGIAADKAANFYTKNLQDSFTKIDKAMGARSTSPRNTGRMVRIAVNKESTRLKNTLYNSGKVMFKGVSKLADQMGYKKAKIVDPKSSVDIFDEHFQVALDNPYASKRYLQSLQFYKKKYLSPSTIDEAMKTKQLINRAKRGEVNLFSGDKLFTRDDSIALAKQLSRAYESDMQSSLRTRLGEGNELYRVWRKANDIYSKNIGKLDSFDESALGKLLGKGKKATLEDFADSFYNMKDSHFESANAYLNKSQRRQVARHLSDRAMKKATEKTGASQEADKISLPGGRENISVQHYLSELKKTDRFLKLFPAKQRDKVKTIIEGMEYQADRLGAGGAAASPESQQKAVAGSTFGLLGGQPGSGIFMVREMYSVIFNKKLTDLLFTEKGQDLVLEGLRGKKINSEALMNAIASGEAARDK